ncbi:cupin domain-containing protein [Grimontia sp. NTOU-MAR1]|uniref:cupin domain-containing protein n=1 Tax=Grimontia sp. NTOU-MAR1 TaxID=3111011 RepID=UPI002DBCE36B|nr:cupin domain-containing protein [Grimontia sp. NTOU-MAR1]WRV99709.1 cupin domain-containing protein [Grimontia sp. NTOU-MAR1]
MNNVKDSVGSNQNRSDDQLGRSRVKDNQVLEDYYSELEGVHTGAFWKVANAIEPWEPKALSEPVVWRNEALRKLVLKSLDLVSPEDAGRRVVYLKNPKRTDVSAACGWLFSGLQVMQPGERAGAHKHAASALRFIMEGKGAYTIVDGHKIDLGARDFVITPNGTWHEHGVSEDGETSIWQDGLDIPLTNVLESNFYAVHPEGYQTVTLPENDSPLTYGAPGLRPELDKWDKPYSPLMKYSWDQSYEALLNYSKVTDGSPYDGVIMRYVNPQTGGDPMLTMGASLQLLRPSEHTKAHRHTGNIIYQVAKGSGYSIINGQRFDWKEKDIFCVPTWMWHEHVNTSSSEDACLFSFNDLPTIKKLGFYVEQALVDNNGHQLIQA